MLTIYQSRMSGDWPAEKEIIIIIFIEINIRPDSLSDCSAVGALYWCTGNKSYK